MATVTVTDYGATADDGTEDSQAFRDAMNAAGAGGTVYVPAGTYRIGPGGIATAQPMRSGDREPKGISFEGDGPEQSIIKWVDGHTDSDGAPRGPIWSDGYDHGSVTIKDLQLDGNYTDMSLGDSNTAWGFEFRGVGASAFTVENCIFRGWWTNGGLVFVGDTTFNFCSFVENGMGSDSTATPGDGHGFNATAPGGEILADNCRFEKCSGVAVDQSSGQSGDVRLRNCYVANMGSGVVKKNDGVGVAYLEQVNADDLTGSWIRANLSHDPDTRGVYNIPNDGDAGKLVMTDVRFRGASWPAILAESRFDLEGDRIVLDDMNWRGDMEGVWDVADGSAHSINRLSIVNTQAAANRLFAIDSGASGSITELNRQNNAVSLGDTDGVSIGTDNTGTAPHSITVPNQDEVGANGTAYTGGGGGSPTPETGAIRATQAGLPELGPNGLYTRATQPVTNPTTVYDPDGAANTDEWVPTDGTLSIVSNPGTRGADALKLEGGFAYAKAYPGATATDLPAYFARGDDPLHVFVSFDGNNLYNGIAYGVAANSRGWELFFNIDDGSIGLWDSTQNAYLSEKFDYAPLADETYEVIIDWSSAGHDIEIRDESDTIVQTFDQPTTQSALASNTGLMISQNNNGAVWLEEVYKE